MFQGVSHESKNEMTLSNQHSPIKNFIQSVEI